jgi:predicted nucleic acid-binding protein
MSVVDTCILIDYLKGDERAARELAGDVHAVMSVISLAELLVGARTPEAELAVKGLAKKVQPVPVDADVAAAAAAIRRCDGLKLPDAIILATAKLRGALLVTRNTRDFDQQSPLIRIPYSV